MAILTIPISNFNLNSTWTAKLTPSVPMTAYITPDPPTVGQRSTSITLGAIPAGSTINTAVLSATLGSAATGVRLSTVDFNGSGNVTFSGSLNVKPYISAFGTVPLLFRFGANGSTSGATVEGTSKYSTLTYSTIKLVVDYTPPAGTPPPPPGALPEPSTLSLSKTYCKAGDVIRASFGVLGTGVTHRVQFLMDASGASTASYDLAAGVAYYDFTIPKSWQTFIPNSTSVPVKVTLLTYDGGPAIGSDEKYFTMTLSNDAYPSITSVTATLVSNGVPAGITRYVQNKSKSTATINGEAGAYGSKISSYSITGNGQTVSDASGTFGVFPTAGSVTMLGRVTDSRGRSVNASVTIEVDAYAPPTLSGVAVYRSDSAGVAQSDGTYLALKATSVFSSLSTQNAASLQGRYKAVDGAYSDWEAMTNNTVLLISGVLVTTSYIVQIQVTDTVGTTYTYTATIPSDTVSFNIKDGGGGAAFGQYAQYDDRLEVAWSRLVVDGHPVQRMLVGYVYLTFGTENPATMYGGTWEQIAAGRFLVASGSGYAVGATGGEATHELTLSEMPSHNHLYNGLVSTASAFGTQSSIYLQRAVGTGTASINETYHNKGGGGAHENRPPYIAVNMWRRTE
jgi:hypothetical protein